MMVTAGSQSRRGLWWALVGAAVLVAGAVAVIVTTLVAQSQASAPPRPSESASVAPRPSPTGPDAAVVDGAVSERGWVPEPITTDAEAYVRAALAAASTFDTMLSSRSDWLTHIDSWFTPDIRYESEQDRLDDMKAAQLELRQAVVLPEESWSSLAAEDGRVAASVDGPVTFTAVPSDDSGDMRIGTADVVLTFTRADGAGGETQYTEHVTVSVQVLCGPSSVPTPNSAQRAGDCRVVRFFSGSLEP